MLNDIKKFVSDNKLKNFKRGQPNNPSGGDKWSFVFTSGDVKMIIGIGHPNYTTPYLYTPIVDIMFTTDKPESVKFDSDDYDNMTSFSISKTTKAYQPDAKASNGYLFLGQLVKAINLNLADITRSVDTTIHWYFSHIKGYAGVDVYQEKDAEAAILGKPKELMRKLIPGKYIKYRRYSLSDALKATEEDIKELDIR